MIELVVGALITFTEPGTTTPLCGRVFHVGESAGGIPTVWAVQQNSGRGFKAPAESVSGGCGPAMPAPAPATAAAVVPTAVVPTSAPAATPAIAPAALVLPAAVPAGAPVAPAVVPARLPASVAPTRADGS